MSTILILHDPTVAHQALTPECRRRGYDTIEGSSEHALPLIRATRPDVVLVDVGVANPHCAELLEQLEQDRQWAGPPVVVLTGVADTCCIWQTCRLAAKERAVTAAFSATEALHQVRRYIRAA